MKFECCPHSTATTQHVGGVRKRNRKDSELRDRYQKRALRRRAPINTEADKAIDLRLYQPPAPVNGKELLVSGIVFRKKKSSIMETLEVDVLFDRNLAEYVQLTTCGDPKKPSSCNPGISSRRRSPTGSITRPNFRIFRISF